MSFTRVGSGVWSWDRFRQLELFPGEAVGIGAKLVWIAIYTAPESRHVPCLFSGSITTLAESMGSSADDVRTFLERLREHGMVEIDVTRRLIRLVELPDCGESPTNGNTIRGWWRRFQNIPPCPVRDRHVHTIRWLLDEYARVNGKQVTPDHERAWNETFGRMAVPAPSPVLPPRRHVQTDLFEASESGKGSERPYQSPMMPHRSDQMPKIPSEEDQVPGSMTEGFRHGPEKDQRSGSGSGQGSGDQDSGPEPAGARVLRLVPVPPVPFDADDLADALARATADRFPRALTRTQRQALQRAIDGLPAMSPPANAARVLERLHDYVKHAMPDFEPNWVAGNLTPELAATPGWLARAITHAMAWSPAPPAPARVSAPGQVIASKEARTKIGLVDRFRQKIGAARHEIIAKYSLEGFRPELTLHGGENETELRCRLSEAGDDAEAQLDHVIAVAVAEADTKREVDWLGWNLGRSRVWDRLLRTSPQAAIRAATSARGDPTSGDSVFDVIRQAVTDHESGSGRKSK